MTYSRTRIARAVALMCAMTAVFASQAQAHGGAPAAAAAHDLLWAWLQRLCVGRVLCRHGLLV